MLVLQSSRALFIMEALVNRSPDWVAACMDRTPWGGWWTGGWTGWPAQQDRHRREGREGREGLVTDCTEYRMEVHVPLFETIHCQGWEGSIQQAPGTTTTICITYP